MGTIDGFSAAAAATATTSADQGIVTKEPTATGNNNWGCATRGTIC